jgi:DNA-binding NarL/FixJ family response regulator
VRAAFEAAVNGHTLLPIGVLRALASSAAAGPIATDAQMPAPRETEWLRQLAEGRSVARLANAAGYSERMMFRLLRELYDRLGVRSRTEALMRARERGWI